MYLSSHRIFGESSLCKFAGEGGTTYIDQIKTAFSNRSFSEATTAIAIAINLLNQQPQQFRRKSMLCQSQFFAGFVRCYSQFQFYGQVNEGL
jgi:hypothetical protein